MEGRCFDMERNGVEIRSKKGYAKGSVDSNGTGHVEVIVAHERGKGIGARLLKALEWMLAKKGAQKAKIDVMETPAGSGKPLSEDELRDFYGKNGYEPEKDGYGMEKKIKNKKKG